LKRLIKSLFITVVALLYSVIGANSQSFEFIENKGQWDKHVKFKGELSTGAFFLKANGYRVLQHDTATFFKAINLVTGHNDHQESGDGGLQPISQNTTGKLATNGLPGKPSGVIVKSHAYDVSFEGASPNAIIETERANPGYSNYILGNDPSQWVSKVNSYGSLVYKNIYPGIDVRYYSENGYLKYDMIMQPNAPVNKIGLLYEGVEALKVKNSELYVTTSVTTVKEQAPYSYQIVDGLRKQVKCEYVVIGNTVKFRLTGYDPSKVLVIDPTLVFCSFTGSGSDNWGYTATYDEGGNLYAGGIVFGNKFPATPGAFQSDFAGGGNTGENAGFDIGIMKFSPTGSQRIYATYLGGKADNEQPHSLVVNKQGELVMAGRTHSNDYPLMPASNLVGSGGGWDIVVSKLNASGTALIGSVRIGGSSDDGVNIKHKYGGVAGPSSLMRNYGDDARSEVIFDGSGDICVASCTQSTNFPTTAGVFQPRKSGNQDGLILKFSPTLANLIFATHIGGNGNDAAYVLGLSPSGDLYAAGGTESDDFPGDKTGTVGANFGGGLIDGFISRISSDGTTLRKSTFIGTNGVDQVYGIQFDKDGDLYVQGTTTGNFPVINAAFSQAGGKQFIAKLQPDMSSYIYFTNWGSNNALPNISPIAFLVDRCENVYVSGWGGNVITTTPSYAVAGTRGLTATPDAIRSATDGNDFYFFVLEKDAQSQLYGTFFGQNDARKISDHVDGGTSRFDQDGIIYQAVCANCQGGQFPITPGVVGSSNPSGRCNEAVIKIAFNFSGIRAGAQPSIEGVANDTVGCIPLTVDFRDTVGLGKTYMWDYGDGSKIDTFNVPTATHTYTRIGTYRVMLISEDSTKCFPRDTSYRYIIAKESILADVKAQYTRLPPCDSFNYRLENLSIPDPRKPFTNTSFTWSFGDGSPDLVTGTQSVTHEYRTPGIYNATLTLNDTNYCNSPDVQILVIRVSALAKAEIIPPPSACAPFTATFTNGSTGASSFTWFFSDGTTSNAENATRFYPVPTVDTIRLVARDTGSCPSSDSTFIILRVYQRTEAQFTFSPNPSEENVITTFNNLSQQTTRYDWDFGDGSSLVTTRRDTVVRHQYLFSNTYNACLVATNEFGCQDTFCLPIPIIVDPLVDVVSAFTPNNDGVNDRAIVFGYGVEKMTFRIYNRWGQMVFESNDVRIGWDGKFKGKPQPMDAYGYTLDADLYNGTRVRKSGSITLLR
jgi:gliding motility-associated-like protein